MNMYKWIGKIINEEETKTMPILSFPSVQLLFVTVRELVSDSNLQALGMKMLADKYDTCAAVSFMDLSVEAEAFGAKTVYAADEVPTIIGSIISKESDADSILIPSIGHGRTGICIEGVRKALKLISDRPVFAGCIGPFSLAGRLMNVNEVMMYCYEEPQMVHKVLRKATDFLIEYILEYKKIGSHGIIMAEPLAGILSPELMKEFSTKYVKEIVEKTQDQNFIVIYHNCGSDVDRLTDPIIETGCLAFHFGDAVNMKEMLSKIPSDRLVMGNISPSKIFRNGTPNVVRIATIRLLENCRGYQNYVISSGCDIPPLTEFDNIDAFFETVKSFNYKNRLMDMIV